MKTQRWGRWGLYAFLLAAAAFFLAPLYVMLATSLKSMDEIRHGAGLLAWPAAPSLAASRDAWSGACTGMACNLTSAQAPLAVGAQFARTAPVPVPTPVPTLSQWDTVLLALCLRQC